MKSFPDPVVDAMRASGAMATCVAVKLGDENDPVDTAPWQAALFIQLAGSESAKDRKILQARDGRPLGVGFECDLIETEHGSVVLLRAEIFTRPQDPLVAEVLLTPGDGGNHFESLKLLCTQSLLSWFFADQSFRIIHSQCHPLGADMHKSFAEILKDAVRHDALVRMSATYDARAALSAVVQHYTLRHSGSGQRGQGEGHG